jgi:hypothetical protein
VQKGGFEDYRAQNSTVTSLVSSRTHAQSEEKDPAVESVEIEGGSSREGKRWTLQYYSTNILGKEEWKVKEKASTPALTASNDDMDLLDSDMSLLIKDESPSPTGMDINMVFTVSVEFRGVKEEVTSMCLGPKEVVFEKPEESS